ncbi:unnamed protein product [Camellia sinensis]
MVGPQRPQFVLFGSSIVQLSFSNDGWGSILADIYARKSCRLGTHPLHIPGTLGRTYPQKQAIDVDIVLRGYYGWNSRRAVQVLDQVFPKDAATQPSLVIVYFGGNDSMGSHSSGLGPHVPLPEYIENMRKIALHLKSLSDTTRVIFLSCPPVNEAKLKENTSKYFSELVRTNELCRSYSEACIELCREMGMKVVDLWTAFQRRDDWLTACFTDCFDWYKATVRNSNRNTGEKEEIHLDKGFKNTSKRIESNTNNGVHLAAGGSKVVVEEILKVLKEAEWEPCLHWKSMPTEFSEDSPFDLVAYDGKTTINPSEWTYHREIQWD